MGIFKVVPHKVTTFKTKNIFVKIIKHFSLIIEESYVLFEIN